MTGTLKVDPAKLRQASDEFKTAAQQMQGQTQGMMEIVRSTLSIWEGEAQQAYQNQFNQLNDDMEQLYNWVTIHSTDLSEMATTYENAEREATEKGSSLPPDIVD